MKLIVVCGQRNSGKTSWVCALVSEYTKRGFKVGTLKHTHHRHDVEGKDTDRHQVSGAEKVLLVSSKGLAIYESYTFEPTLEKLSQMYFSDFDIVFAEGYRTSEEAKIVVDNDPDANTVNVIADVPPAIDGVVEELALQTLVEAIEGYFKERE